MCTFRTRRRGCSVGMIHLADLSVCPIGVARNANLLSWQVLPKVLIVCWSLELSESLCHLQSRRNKEWYINI